MIPGLYQSAAGMMAQMENHQIIAENLAASSVPGFRRNQTSFESYLNPMMKGGDTGITNMPAPSIPQMQVNADFTPGQIEQDGNSTHIALSGEGFFVVELPNGGGQGYT